MAPSPLSRSLGLLVGLGAVVHALPAPDPVENAQAQITPPPYRIPQIPTRTLNRRDILSDLEGDVKSVLGALGSDIPSYVASGTRGAWTWADED